MNKKIIYMTLLSATMLLGSCKDEFLDQTPYSSLPIDTAITTEAELQAAANGMYASMRSFESYGRNIPVLGDLLADNTWISANNAGRYIAQNNFAPTVSSAEPNEMWNQLYTTILRANIVINADIPTSPVVEQLKGEAYAARALSYFSLVRVFALPYTVDPGALGVPVVTEFDQNASPARSSVSEVYAQIISDYEAAYTMMTVNKNSSYMSKYAARALQAKAYLYMGDYEKAKTAALDVVENGGYTLVQPEAYVAYWNNAAPVSNKVETIFEISVDGVNNLGTNALAYIYEQDGYGDILATEELYDLYSEEDVRQDVIIEGARGTDTGIYIVNKYSNTTNAADKDDIKIIRYAEVMLILAEAYARTGDDAQALVYLNRVAAARNADLHASAGAKLIEDIITERRKELAFEGDRYYDLLRLNRPIERSDRSPAAVQLIEVGSTKRQQPIPQSEIDANPNVKQNPGYS